MKKNKVYFKLGPAFGDVIIVQALWKPKFDGEHCPVCGQKPTIGGGRVTSSCEHLATRSGFPASLRDRKLVLAKSRTWNGTQEKPMSWHNGWPVSRITLLENGWMVRHLDKPTFEQDMRRKIYAANGPALRKTNGFSVAKDSALCKELGIKTGWNLLEE
ncbi:MAG: hypothetical protein ACOZAO_03950 [Patescibacteria group bacterium]